MCRILALYWDLIPSSAATPLLLLLTRDLAHDASANAVRAAVPAGLKYLLQHGSAPSCVGALRGSAAVRSPLNHVAPLVHDASQRVRTAALDLAIEVAKVKGGRVPVRSGGDKGIQPLRGRGRGLARPQLACTSFPLETQCTSPY